MLKRRSTIYSTTLVAAALGLALWAGQPSARGDGVSGRAQSATGCSCHSSTPDANGAVTVTISGPQTVVPSSTNSYTIEVTGGPAGTTGGVDLVATAGTLIAGTGSTLLNGDLVHSDKTRRSWTFQWTAPATPGVQNFYAVGQATNGSGSSGDSWNFSGGALNAAYPIDVNALVSATPLPQGLWLGPATPNPAAGATAVQFTLPAASPVELDVINVAGRRVATLLATTLPEGTHSASWNGRTANGSAATVGLYFIRLRALDVERTTRVMLIP